MRSTSHSPHVYGPEPPQGIRSRQDRGNAVFIYLDAFDEDWEAVEQLKKHYRRGGLGDTTVKKRLEDVLQALIAPIRERRAAFAERPDGVLDVIRSGTATSRAVTQAALDEVRDALGLFRLRQASSDRRNRPFDLAA